MLIIIFYQKNYNYYWRFKWNKNSKILLLIQDNKLTDKVIKIFKYIFNTFSYNGKMDKTQYTQFASLILNKEINLNSFNVNNYFFYYDINNDEILSF